MTKGFHSKFFVDLTKLLMCCFVLEKKSKRVLAKRRYKVEKKVREHNKKLRRASKKKEKRKTKPEFDKLGVPNSAPFKEEVLKEAQEEKQKIEELRKLRREEQAKQRQNSKDKELNERRGIEQLGEDAKRRQEEFEKSNQGTSNNTNGNKKGTQYAKEFQKVVEAADVIIQVLDARDPLGTRCKQVEQTVIQANKRLILLLNKIDLVPSDNLESWVRYLRNEFPTLTFKANTQNQKHNLGRIKNAHAKDDQLQSSKCAGADILMKMLGNYCRNKGIKTSITVGFVGLPNVGKSSVINSMKRSRVCTVGATPGLTKSMQTIALDKHIKLIDCPGVVFLNDNSMALKNAVKTEQLDDAIGPVEEIMKKVSNEELMLHYNLPGFQDTNEFLSLLAKKTGKLKKGGVPNLNVAAKKVIDDWNCGKIKYFSKPPAQNQDNIISAEIVKEWGKEFSIDDLDTMEVD